MKHKRTLALILALSLANSAYCLPYVPDSGIISGFATESTNSGILYNVHNDYIEITGCDRNNTEITIPEMIENLPVKAISAEAFSNFSALEKISLPDTVENIGAYAFWGCSKMKMVSELPSSLKEIGSGAFYRCDGLTEIEIPQGVEKIEQSTFYWCENLKTVSMGDNVYSIGDSAFEYCNSLSTLRLSENLVTIGNEAFYSCNMLTETNIPQTVTYIGYHAFGDSPCAIDVPVSASQNFQTNSSRNDFLGNSALNLRNGKPVLSYIKQKDSGIEILTANENKYINITNFDGNDSRISEGNRTIGFELPVFGGAFYGEKYNFIVFGASNYSENNDTEVYRIVKYSKNWERLDSCSIYGQKTYYSLVGGSLRMDEYNGMLYVHTCHQMYADKNGTNHQANFAFNVNQEDMTYNVNSSVYASHSFNQFVKTDGSEVYYADLGDAYPRSIAISNSRGKSATALKIGGRFGDNYTGVSVGGFELSDDSCIIAANTVNQEDFNAKSKRNIFISLVKKDFESSENIFLTDYAPNGNIDVLPPKLIKADEKNFFVLWEEYDSESNYFKTMFCKFNTDSRIPDITELKGDYPLSDCQPVIDRNGFILWFTVNGDGEQPKIYRLDPNDPNGTVPANNVFSGDANLDGEITAADAVAILQHLGNRDKYGLTEQGTANADVYNCGDGVTALDALAIQKLDAGVITSLPVNS